MAASFEGLSADERQETIVAQHMLYSVPEARGLLYAEYTLLIDLMTRALAYRLGASVSLTERRIIAGTIIGVLIAASEGNPLPEESLTHSLEILESKLAW